MEESNSTEAIIMVALSTLTPPQLSSLTHSIFTLFHRHRRRLSAVLSSPTLFSFTLLHLHSLSLHHKSLLIARHLLSTLTLLAGTLDPNTTTTAAPPYSSATKLRDLDSVLLLLLLCELRQHNPQALETSPTKWRIVLSEYISDTMLTLSNIAVSSGSVLTQYIELVTNCRRFVGIMDSGGGEAAEVVALPSVEVTGDGRECVICKEEMREGRDVCELSCNHLFHWICILPWLEKKNTCPCCRRGIPTDDVFGEIDRLWEVVVKVASLYGEYCR